MSEVSSSDGGSSSRRKVRPRGTLRPIRNPGLQQELNNDRIYSVLYELWISDISKNGPAPEALIGTALFGTAPILYEIYHVFPATKALQMRRLRDFLSNVGDMFEFGSTRVIMSPGLLIALDPEGGDLIWAGVASRLESEQLTDYVWNHLSKHVELEPGSVGWVGY